jgi:folate-binding protein YgfZ
MRPTLGGVTRPPSVLLGLPDAVPAGPPDAGVVWHYGDPLREQRLLAEQCAVVDRSHRDVLAVPGADRLSWLHAITSQHLSGLADGQGTQALVLDPHGHVEHHLQLMHADATVWIDTEPGQAPALLDYLDRMRFMSRVEPVDLSQERAVLSVGGPRTDAVLVDAGLPVPGVPAYSVAGTGAVLTRRMSWPVAGAVDLLVARSDVGEVVARLREAGAGVAGSWAWEALRVAARAPRLGCETDHRTIPHELGWVATPEAPVHLDKGCYRGQETVARVHNLGRPPRRLVLLHLDGSEVDLPSHGAPVASGGRDVGWIGTVARHWELGPIALAVVKRQVADAAQLTAGGLPAAVEPVPAAA